MDKQDDFRIFPRSELRERAAKERAQKKAFRLIPFKEIIIDPEETAAISEMAYFGDVMAITGNHVAGQHAAVQHLLDAFATETHGFLKRPTQRVESVFISLIDTPDIGTRNAYNTLSVDDEKTVRTIVQRHMPVGLIVLNRLDWLELKDFKWVKSYANEIGALIAVVGEKLDDDMHADVDVWVECNWSQQHRHCIAKVKKVREFTPINGSFRLPIVGGYNPIRLNLGYQNP